MNTIKTGAAVVTGARHLRTGRNGQDAVVVCRRGEGAVAVVCDGCSSGGSSEVGSRLGAPLFARAIETRLLRGESAFQRATWEAARDDLAATLADLLERMPGDRAATIREQFLFTIVAAAITADGAAVWALGDGLYCLGGPTVEIGPFDDNAPPYLAYDLLDPHAVDRAEAMFVTAPCAETIIIATDGAAGLPDGLAPLCAPLFVAHPDALRRHLALLARTPERIDWIASRVVRTPAVLQDDCAVAILRTARAA